MRTRRQVTCTLLILLAVAGGCSRRGPTSVTITSGFSYRISEEWEQEPPEWLHCLPKVVGDPEDAELEMLPLPHADDVERHIEFLCGKFEREDGRPWKDVLERTHRDVNGVPVTEFALEGRFWVATAPHGGQRFYRKNWAMLAAILELPNGPYCFQVTGPEKTVERWRKEFGALVSSVNI